MGLAEIVRSAVSIANTQTGALQANVTLEAWTGDDSYNKPTYAAAVTIPAIVELKQAMRKTSSGKEVLQQASVTFVRTVTANGATGRREPIDPRDRITLPNGQTGPILDVIGLVDPSTNAPYMLEVILGGNWLQG